MTEEAGEVAVNYAKGGAQQAKLKTGRMAPEGAHEDEGAKACSLGTLDGEITPCSSGQWAEDGGQQICRVISFQTFVR